MLIVDKLHIACELITGVDGCTSRTMHCSACGQCGAMMLSSLAYSNFSAASHASSHAMMKCSALSTLIQALSTIVQALLCSHFILLRLFEPDVYACLLDVIVVVTTDKLQASRAVLCATWCLGSWTAYHALFSLMWGGVCRNCSRSSSWHGRLEAWISSYVYHFICTYACHLHPS